MASVNASADVTIHGHVFGGGNDAGVETNTTVNIGGGQIDGNVYGGGNLGDVGAVTHTPDLRTFTWSKGGTCTVSITNGTIGTAGTPSKDHGNVFGAGKGLEVTFECEKAIVKNTSVSISNGTVNGNVYGGGQIGRVEEHTVVTIGLSTGTSEPVITGSVYGAGAGVNTHGYSALVRGNSTVTIQGQTDVGHSVYGGGEIASVGKYGLDAKGMPSELLGGGVCTVTVEGSVEVGKSGSGDVFGAGKGFVPGDNEFAFTANDTTTMPKRMMKYNSALYNSTNSGLWAYYGTSTQYVWEYFDTSEKYSVFLETLALATAPTVTIGTASETPQPSINGSVYGGGEVGITKGTVVVNINGGTIEDDVYGGGKLADTNTGNWSPNKYVPATPPYDTSETLYTRTGAGTTESPYVYTAVESGSVDQNASSGTYFKTEGGWTDASETAWKTTTVNLLGGYIKGDAYGGGLGQKEDFNGASSDIAATVWGDIYVTLNGTKFDINYYNETGYTDVVTSGRVFGCNNLNGSPKGDVTVTVNRTVAGNTGRTTGTVTEEVDGVEQTIDKRKSIDPNNHSYELAAVYGGGNLAPFTTTGKKTHVIIRGCNDTSILTVYGGGNAAPVPETAVDIYSCYEIGSVFGGGNGKDKYKNDNGWQDNPGANVNGPTTTWIYGGTVHEAYGASNKKGTITGTVLIDVANTNPDNCTLDVAKIVGAGKDADVNGDLIMVMGCKPGTKVPVLYAGADNAHVNGNVELTITSGKFGQVFGGNNAGGYILGHIKLNIEETGDCATPIEIDELYLGGNEAKYSQYGYYNAETDPTKAPNYQPRTAEMADAESSDFKSPIGEIAGMTVRKEAPYGQPELNIISCTYIGQVFGGGYGTGASLYGNPKVNINMIPGSKASGVPAVMTAKGLTSSENPNNLGIIGTVYGGGNAADVIGDPTVNIGTLQTVDLVSTGVTGNTVVGAYISGNVFGGGKGEAKTVAGTDGEAFLCAKAMVKGDVGTHVNIGNGFVRGNVYGGGEVGRVEHNTAVKIGLDAADVPEGKTSAPTIKGNVFGAGKGVNTHGYSALVRGNSTVTVQADSKVEGSVYGGGEMASVGKYRVENGLPVALEPDNEHPNSGYCYVYILGNAEIGPDNMEMTKLGGPSDAGHVFGAGKGVMPYEGYDADAQPFHMNGTQHKVNNVWDGKSWDDAPTWYDAYDPTKENTNKYADYIKFIKSLALATQTVVEISGNPFIKGSVYGGSENGFVQHDTHVTISGGQIGNGYVQMDDDGNYLATKVSVNRRYTSTEWTNGALDVTNDRDELKNAVANTYYKSSLPECASWPYGQAANEADRYAPYDKLALSTGYYSATQTEANSAKGGRPDGDDGHTFYGNVFAGGSGYYPYKPGRWFEDAGAVYGNTYLTISGGHILTSVYGGNEMTDVGTYDADDQLKLKSGGTCNVTMTGGTIGVPRTLKQIEKHPVTCYLFGAGKGDQRVFFNKSTNIGNAVINISADARIYGSIFGGGEDGHVMKNVTMNILAGTTKTEGSEEIQYPYIGTWGTSYVDGNVFGGGRGFGGDAYTAGNVAGTVTMTIEGGTMLGSIYGGGRLGSVGYGLFDASVTDYYGKMRPDDTTESFAGVSSSSMEDFPRGYVYMTIGTDEGTGPTIGNKWEYKVPSASNGPTNNNEPTLPANISNWSAANWTTWKEYNHVPKTLFDTSNGRLLHTKGGNVFAGGMGRREQLDGVTSIPEPVGNTGIDWHKLGNVKSTTLTIKGGTIKSCVYGGGELGAVQEHHTTKDAQSNDINVGTEVIIQGTSTTIGTEVMDGSNVKYTFGSVYGGGYGTEADVNDTYITDVNKLAGLVWESTNVNMTAGHVWGSVFGGGEMACVGGNTTVAISGGEIGKGEVQGSTDPIPNYVKYGGATMGNVFGGGKGSENAVISGLVKGNTNVTISAGSVSGEPKIYHNVYGGGALGSVGTFSLATSSDNEANHVSVGTPISWTNGTGTSTVNITGGTIGITGWDNGMVNGASRGGEGDPNNTIVDRLAWVKTTNVTIGTSSGGPYITGSVYGGGENGHNSENSTVTVNGGTIGYTSYNFATNSYECGNVYGSGCGTDKYDTNNDGTGDTYNPMAGIVRGTTTVNVTGGTVRHNVYGAGSMASVGTMTTDNTGAVTIHSGGTTNVTVSGGTVGADGNKNGDVFGAARGDKTTTENNLALVKETNVVVSGSTSTTQINGNVYGGGEVGNVHTNTRVNVQGGAIAKNVFGGGKGSDHNFTCDKAMVGVNNDGAGEGKDPALPAHQDKGTIVTISNGTIGTLGTNNQLAENTGNVYGGGEIGRVEWNTQVKIGIGEGEGTYAPIIYGNVYGAGKGLATHGYSALVRGNCTVTVQGGAKVGHNVYGGGENSTAGRYWVKNINNIDAQKKPIPGAPIPPDDLPDGMPYQQQSGGICSVTIQGEAEIGYNGAAADAGHVYGAGKGVKPSFTPGTTDRMVNNASGGSYVAFEDEIDTETNEVVKTAEELYLEFLQTLALATNSSVTIGESAQVKGSVFGGSESGFVQHDTNVTINNGTIGTTASYGNVFGGGRGLEEFAEAGKVKGNTRVTINNGTMYGNVYGGGNLGDVGLITKPADYNYVWKQTDGTTANTSENNNITGTSNNTGVCKVIITGGTIGISGVDSQEHGNVFGGSRGSSTTWWCEKAMVFATNVSVSGSTVVHGTVYGGGEVGRVQDDGKVTIGTAGASGEGSEPDIKGDVFGAGAGLQTHGYSALLRGNAEVTVQGIAQVGGSVYGGGEIASVGRFTVVKGLPTKPENGGICIVNIKDNAKIGSSGTDHHVFGACKGVTPNYVGDYKNFKSMQLESNKGTGVKGTDWDYYVDDDGKEDRDFVWVYYKTEADYLAFLKTLALTSHPHVTIGGTWTPNETTGTITPAGTPSVFGSVYGGGQRGVTLGHVDVNIIGGTVKLDVYGGGALADTNLGNWDVNGYVLAAALNDGESITDLYSRTGTEGNYTYTKIKDSETTFTGNTYYRQQATWAHDTGSAYYTTSVDLHGGTIDGDVYGGGHGNATTEAEVYGDVEVKLNEAVANDNCKVKGQIFGCNNMNGSPKGGVTVHVYKTVGYDTDHQRSGTKNNTTYEVAAVFGGGNQAAYNPQEPNDAKSVANVIIDGCDLTSIETVYGGGNAASAPATHVTVNGCYEIGTVFGGGYGAGENNPGANVGYKSDGTTAYGLGTTTVDLFGGVVHEAFGSSNTRGIVREEAHVNLDEKKDGNGNVCCPMLLDEVYGGGNEAYMEGGTKVDLGCITKLKTIYGGAKNANVNGDINMTIQSGTYDRVFGGNNVGGTISGTITVNIEETGCHPIIIGQLFGGGNQAAYTAPFEPGSTEERQPGPTINVRSFTSIGEIYGGGYGQTAVVTGDTYVNVNECVWGNHEGEDTHTDANDAIKHITFTEYVRTADGGFELDGNGDKVTRNVTVDVFMPEPNDVKSIGAIHRIFGGGNAANVDGNTHVKIGTLSQTTFVTPKTASETDRTKAVVGADIRDNVYGGGNQADVTGDTEVIIGQEGQGD